METKHRLLLILICLCSCSIASAAAPSWIYGETGPSDWTINPPNPGDTDVISFSGPIGFYGNSCFAEADLGGTPMISVDTTNKIIELWFQGPAPIQCILIYQPVSGLQGTFGPLTPGTWTFRSTVPEIAFERVFTVSGAMSGSTYYVDKDAPGPFHNGTSWKWAFLNLQNALDAVVSGDIILVAEGTYKPDQGDSVTAGDRTASFQLKNGVTVLGGYAGYGQPNPNDRNVETHTTVLNGDLLGDDLWGILNKDDNSYHVVSATGCASCSSTLDGFTITGGQADGSIPYNAGGGVYIDGANPMLKNCTLTGNVAGFGGAIASLNNASPSVLNCKIIGNSARISGGGLYCYSNNINVTNCLLAGNSAYQGEYLGGSAIYNLGGSLNISDCTIADQSAPNGMAITSFIWTFPAANSLTINNSILYNGGDEILTNHQETISVNYTDIQGGWIGTGTGNINSNPKFVDLGLWSIEGQYIVGDFHLQSSSPCIDKGNNSLLPSDQGDLDEDGNTTEQLPVDLDGAARKQGTKVDMGAYEYGGTTPTPEPEPGPWEQTDGADIIFDIPNPPPAFPISVSGEATFTLLMNFQGILKAEIEATSAAGGTWNAWFDPDPGVVGPGYVTVTVKISGTNVDVSQLSPGPHQKLAELKIFVQPI